MTGTNDNIYKDSIRGWQAGSLTELGEWLRKRTKDSEREQSNRKNRCKGMCTHIHMWVGMCVCMKVHAFLSSAY